MKNLAKKVSIPYLRVTHGELNWRCVISGGGFNPLSTGHALVFVRIAVIQIASFNPLSTGHALFNGLVAVTDEC